MTIYPCQVTVFINSTVAGMEWFHTSVTQGASVTASRHSVCAKCLTDNYKLLYALKSSPCHSNCCVSRSEASLSCVELCCFITFMKVMESIVWYEKLEHGPVCMSVCQDNSHWQLLFNCHICQWELFFL